MFRGVLGASWARLGCLRIILGGVWGVLGLSWGGYKRLLGRVRASWGVLGEPWARFSRQKDAELRHSILDAIFYFFLIDYRSENRSPNL